MPLTRIVVAHRPETIAGAQRVVQLVGGVLSERLGASGELPAGKLKGVETVVGQTRFMNLGVSDGN